MIRRYYGPSLLEALGLSGDSAVLLGSGMINIIQVRASLQDLPQRQGTDDSLFDPLAACDDSSPPADRLARPPTAPDRRRQRHDARLRLHRDSRLALRR